MSVISDIRDKKWYDVTPAEKCFLELWETNGLESFAEEGARELADLRAENKNQKEALEIAVELLKFAKNKLDGELDLCNEVGTPEWEWKWKVRYFLSETEIPFRALPDDMRDA